MSTQLCESTRPPAYEALIGRWRQGERASAREALSQNPELSKHKSIVLDLALEEFSLRSKSGETIRPSTFCDQFPGYRRSLRKLIRARCFLDSKQVSYEAAMADAVERAVEEAERACRWPEPREQFLGFELLEELGQGSYARVYLARQLNLGGRLVALKIAQRYGANEANQLGRLQHSNIVPVHSIDTDPATGLTAVCMTYLGKATLCDLLDGAFVRWDAPDSAAIIQKVAQDSVAPGGSAAEQRGAWGESYVDAVARIVLQLAEALAYTHAQGILHRDLKPSNVLLTPKGVPMLLDFNLSIEVRDLEAGVGGTLHYMPPELLRWVSGEGRDPTGLNSPRTDLFSLGVIFHELLTGVLPFGDPEPGVTNAVAIKELLSRQAAGIPAASRRNPRVDRTLDRIIARCVASDPALRYPSADDLALDLRRYFSPWRRRSRWALRRRRTFLIGGALAVLLGAGGAALAWREAEKLPDFDRVSKPTNNETPLPEAAKLSDFEQGQLEYERGEFALAKVCFDRHLQEHPTDGQAFLARGKSHWKLGDLKSAEQDFMDAVQFSPSGEIEAWLGYCLNLRKLHAAAVQRYNNALAAGYDNASLRNNLGFALRKCERFSLARESLDLAVERDPEMRAARHNRLQLELQLATTQARAPSPEALDDLDQALELGLPNRELLLDGAWLYALVAREQPELRERARQLLIQAIALGVTRAEVQANPKLRILSADRDVDRAYRTPSSMGQQVPLELVIPPR